MSVQSKKIRVVKEFRGQLSGKVAAQRDFAKLCHLIAGVRPGATVVLDFAGVSYVSGSWVNWALLPLIRFAGEEMNDLYVIAQGFPDISVDDLQLVAEKDRLPVLVVSLANPDEGVVYGALDPVQRETLKAAVKQREVTGASLATEKITGPAWNNRLRDLNLKRLLRRRREGREQIYSPLVAEVRING